VVYEMWKSGLFEDGSYAVTYFAKENVGPCFLDDCEDDYFELFEDDVYEAGFDDGFRQGYQSACEEVKADIYVDTEKVCKIDQLQHEILELGNKLHPSDIDKLNAVLKRVVDLKYEVAKAAVDEYLGYK
jgi:flagellar biosynthesis/type III secretory pathway protein FliH